VRAASPSIILTYAPPPGQKATTIITKITTTTTILLLIVVAVVVVVLGVGVGISMRTTTRVIKKRVIFLQGMRG
jgi:hypothetical protein